MEPTTAGPIMPRRSDEPKRKDVPVKMDSDVVRLAKIVAAYKDKSLAAYLSDLVRPIVERELEQEQEKTRKPKGTKVPKDGGQSK